MKNCSGPTYLIINPMIWTKANIKPNPRPDIPICFPIIGKNGKIGAAPAPIRK